jgi:hypothetical protein
MRLGDLARLKSKRGDTRMPARRRSTSTGSSATPRSVAKNAAPLGVDCAFMLSAESRPALALSYWDLWFVLVAHTNFDGSWDRFVEPFRAQKGNSRQLAERKLSHIRDLQQRLKQVDVELSAIVAQADQSPVELRRARNQVLKRTPRAHEWSAAMRYTPKQRRYAYALRGFWPSFPVSPASHAERLASQFQTRRWFSENQSFGVARKLDTFLERVVSLLNRDQYAQAQAMLRAFLTVVIELMPVVDDSFGCVGSSFHDGFAKYLAIPLEETGIERAVFFHDLLMLLIWEDYGLTYDQTDRYFERLTPEESDLCIDYLRQQREELKGDDLDYQYEEALTLLGQVAAEQNRFDLFEDLASQMGTRHWKRIVVLADRAVKKRKRKLAVAVFEAALSPGMHEGFLRQKYEQLQRGKWNPDPRR